MEEIFNKVKANIRKEKRKQRILNKKKQKKK